MRVRLSQESRKASRITAQKGDSPAGGARPVFVVSIAVFSARNLEAGRGSTPASDPVNLHPLCPIGTATPKCPVTAGFVARASGAILTLAALLLIVASADRVSAQIVTEAVSRIRSIQASDSGLSVVVGVPAGSRRITLETRSRIARGTWTPREVRWTASASASEIVFRLPALEGTELIRVRDEADTELAAPRLFFEGASVFKPSRTAGSGAGPVVGPVGPNFGVVDGGANRESTGLDAGTTPVVESDIWKLDGRTAYFFNAQRGLQVIDLSNLDQPRITGFLPIAVWGEQLYRLPGASSPSAWLALLAQQGCAGQGSEVLLVEVNGGKPTLRGRLPIRGQIAESRLVGSVLHVVSSEWLQDTINPLKDPTTGQALDTWECHTFVASLDLSDPAQPVVASEVDLWTIPGAVQATDRFLFVATTGSRIPRPEERLAEWVVAGNRGVVLFDLRKGRLDQGPAGYFRTEGRVSQKFNIGVFGSEEASLAVVSQVDGEGRLVPGDPAVGGGPVWEWTPSRTVLETFSLSALTNRAPVGQITLVKNESLFGTRFAGDRAYIVTFRVVDPLWIVDLSDPARPQIRGELEIPGYSTFLQPLANNTRLLTLGVDGSRTAVQLFDVADPGKPALLSKVVLGEGWSWTEGNVDEKAFQVFPEAGLILVPWQGQRGTSPAGSWFRGVQLIDLDLAQGQLKARGVIDHAMQARRATWIDSRVVSLSSQELLSVDAVDRDQPRVRAELPLSRRVDRVFLTGDRLIQIGQGNDRPALLTLTSATATEVPIAALEIDPLPILGADLRGNRLVLLQGRPETWSTEKILVTNPVVRPILEPPFRVTNWVVEPQWSDVRVPGELVFQVVDVAGDGFKLRSRTVWSQTNLFTGESLSALWIRPGLMVWTESGTAPGWGLGDWVRPMGPVGRPIGILPGFWWGSPARHYLAVDLQDPTQPRRLSEVRLSEGGDWASSTPSWLSGTRVHVGHRTSKYVPGTDPGSTNTPPVPDWIWGSWEHQDHLDVIDFADPGEPVVRKPLMLPGTLAGLSHGGEVVYAIGSGLGGSGQETNFCVHALGYDGVAVRSVTQSPLPDSGSGPVLVDSTGRIQVARRSPAAVESWILSDLGKLVRVGEVPLGQEATTLRELEAGRILAVGAESFGLLEREVSGALVRSGVAERPCSLWTEGSGIVVQPSSALWIPRGELGLWNAILKP